MACAVVSDTLAERAEGVAGGERDVVGTTGVVGVTVTVTIKVYHGRDCKPSHQREGHYHHKLQDREREREKWNCVKYEM